MISPHTTSVSLGATGAATATTKARIRFNTLVEKLEAQRKRLAQWHAAIPRMRARAQAELKPIEETINQRRRALAFLFDRACENKLFKKKEREKLSALIVDLTADQVGEGQEEALNSLYERHAPVDDDSEDMPTFDEIKAMMKNSFGIDADAAEATEEEADSRAAQEKAGHAERKPSAKEARQAAEEQRLQQSVREIFRKLASALHPDREPDHAERERKTALMQRANAAYAAQDLLGLLELQFEVEQIDQAALETLDDERIKQYNKVLTRQVGEVRRDIEELEHWLVYVFGISPRGRMTPATLDRVLSAEKSDMLESLAHLEHDLVQFQNLAELKDFLKGYTLRKRPSFFDDDFY